MDQGVKSRPRYKPLVLDLTGRRHFVVTDQLTLPVAAFQQPPIGAEIWTSAFVSAIANRLAIELTGLRVYAVGTEGFIWDTAAACLKIGMTSGEFFLYQATSLRRRVYCSHCKSLNNDVTTNIVICSGCSAHLFVRDHFSARLGAYMGVQADAEIRGDLPPVEELYP